jgi:protein-tyrosine phosphatase
MLAAVAHERARVILANLRLHVHADSCLSFRCQILSVDSIDKWKIATMERDRVLRLEGVHNFRDYGGYRVTAGGRLKRGLLWRSGQHHGATDADLARIAALQLVAVYDLRTEQERTRHPCRRPVDFGAEVHFPPVPSRMLAPHVAAAATTKQRTAESTRESMRRNYGHIAFRPELIAMMRAYLAGLAAGRGPTLINCMAGKDRTGVAVAMLHLATGVHRDDIIEDYLLTNTAGDIEARIAAGAETIRAMGSEPDPDVLRVIMGVEPEYLDCLLKTVQERHGSIDAYLEEQLGADGSLRERLREALVEA